MKISVRLFIRPGRDGQPLPVLDLKVGEDSYRVFDGEPIKNWSEGCMTGHATEVDIPSSSGEALQRWRDPKDKPPHLPGEHHSEDVLIAMKPRALFGEEDHGIRIGHVSLGHWRPAGGNGNFDDDVLGWMPLPPSPTDTEESK